MNKSIMKTRNQLERITYKINQLKNKYAGENQVHPLPKHQSKNNRIQLCMQHQNDTVLRDKNLLSNTQTHNIKYPSSKKQPKRPHNGHDERDLVQSHRKSVPVVPAILQISSHSNYESNQNNDVMSQKSLNNFKTQIFKVLDQTINAKIKAIYREDNNCEKERALEGRLMEFIKENMSDSQCNTNTQFNQSKDTRMEELESRFGKIQQTVQRMAKREQMSSYENGRVQSQLKAIMNRNQQKMRQQILIRDKKSSEELFARIQQIEEQNDRKIRELQNKVEAHHLKDHQSITTMLDLKQQFKSFTIKFQGLQKQNHKYSQIISKLESVAMGNEQAVAKFYLQLNQIKVNCEQVSSQISQVMSSQHKNPQLDTKFQHFTNQITNLFQFYQQNKIQLDQLSQQIQNSSLNLQSTNQEIPVSVINYLEDQLNQFQADINQTLKLLYDDIENKVNQMLAPQQSEPKDNRTIETIQNLRQQLSFTVGTQLDRLGGIMQKTVEEIETKMEKLDQNFGYVYDRMSKIEYDNALFKDQLTVKGKLEARREGGPDRNQDDGLLNILGSLSKGSQMSTLGIIE